MSLVSSLLVLPTDASESLLQTVGHFVASRAAARHAAVGSQPVVEALLAYITGAIGIGVGAIVLRTDI